MGTLHSGAVIRGKYKEVLVVPAGLCAGILGTRLGAG